MVGEDMDVEPRSIPQNSLRTFLFPSLNISAVTLTAYRNSRQPGAFCTTQHLIDGQMHLFMHQTIFNGLDRQQGHVLPIRLAFIECCLHLKSKVLVHPFSILSGQSRVGVCAHDLATDVGRNR